MEEIKKLFSITSCRRLESWKWFTFSVKQPHVLPDKSPKGLVITLIDWFYNVEITSKYKFKSIKSNNNNNNNWINIIDFIWFNLWKELHLWHFYTPILWQVCSNWYQLNWYETYTDSHYWDWWLTFWKLIYWFKQWWGDINMKTIWEHYTSASLPKYKTLAEKEFKLLEDWDKYNYKLWKSICEVSLNSSNKSLKLLDIQADWDFRESHYSLIWIINQTINELVERGIAIKNNDGSIWVDFKKQFWVDLPSCMILKADWTPWYLATDIATIKQRSQWLWQYVNSISYFTDSRQSLHFKQLFQIATQAWWIRTVKVKHYTNWILSLNWTPLSSSKGNVLPLHDILTEAINKAWPIIWIGSIKYEVLKRNPKNNVNFNWEQTFSNEWNSSWYIQYTNCRINSLKFISNNKIDYSDKLIKINISKQLLLELLYWKSYPEPYKICWALYQLCKDYNSLYSSWIKISNSLQLIKMSKWVWELIELTMELLWIKLPIKM